MPVVRKQVIAPGTYWIGGRPVQFTPGDIHAMWRGTRSMLRSGVAIPVPLEHQDDAKPVSMSERHANSVKHNAGWVNDLVLLNGSIYADMDIPDPELAKKLPTTIKFVSPEIDPDFTDGAGRRWGPVVTHVALTTKPVWSGQQPFGSDGASALPSALAGQVSRWSRQSGKLRLSMAAALNQAGNGWFPKYPIAFGWTAYQGPRGGKGWKNDETGKIVYGATKPNDSKGGVSKAAPKAAKPAAKAKSGNASATHDIESWVRPVVEKKANALLNYLVSTDGVGSVAKEYGVKTHETTDTGEKTPRPKADILRDIKAKIVAKKMAQAVADAGDDLAPVAPEKRGKRPPQTGKDYHRDLFALEVPALAGISQANKLDSYADHVKLSDRSLSNARALYTRWANLAKGDTDAIAAKVQSAIDADKKRMAKGETHAPNGAPYASRMLAYRHILDWADADHESALEKHDDYTARLKQPLKKRLADLDSRAQVKDGVTIRSGPVKFASDVAHTILANGKAKNLSASERGTIRAITAGGTWVDKTPRAAEAVRVGGKVYREGEIIPKEVIDSLPAAERPKLAPPVTWKAPTDPVGYMRRMREKVVADMKRGEYGESEIEPFLRAAAQEGRGALKAKEFLGMVQDLHPDKDSTVMNLSLAWHRAFRDAVRSRGHCSMQDMLRASRLSRLAQQRTGNDLAMLEAYNFVLARCFPPKTIALSRRCVLRMAAERSPKGGVTINGTFYPGGRFIPSSEIAKASPEERAKIEQAKGERIEKRKAGGDVGAKALQEKMFATFKTKKAKKEFEDAMGDDGVLSYRREYANRSYKALLDHHGDLFMHRVRELVDKDIAALKKGERVAANGMSLVNRLAVAKYWMDRYERERAEGVDARGADGAGAGGAGGINAIVMARPELTAPADTGVVPKHLHKHLNDIQLQGAAKGIAAIDAHGGFLLADGPGTGKTRQALAIAATYAARGKKVLYVAPVGIVRDEKGNIKGSLGKDAKAMGVNLAANFKGDRLMQPGETHVVGYEQLGKLKDQIDKDTIVIFDEAHSLKNEDSIRSTQGREISAKAGGVVLATATPADRTKDLAYTFRVHLEPPPIQETIKQLDPDKVGPLEAYKRTGEVFDKLTQAGVMVKRELSLDNMEVQFDEFDLPPEAHAELAKLKGPGAEFKKRFLQEKFKIPKATQDVAAELAEGRQVILFVGSVSGEGEQKGTAGMMRDSLIAAGIPAEHIAELHGGEGGGGTEAVDGFQSGKHKIIITTVQSGSTGHNMDDTTGNAPRTTYYLTPPFSAIEAIQGNGRGHRLTTKSKSRVRYAFARTPIDDMNRALLADKFRALNAIVKGEVGKQIVSEREGFEKKSKAKRVKI